jgi:para-nitrobenzyl esterase
VDGETLQGRYFGDDPSQAVFKGIPFAAPPIGDGRWRPPAPIVPRPGVQPATDFGPACMQTGGNVVFNRDIAEVFGTDPQLVPDLEQTSEDCLYLNVWTSNWGGGEQLPVMVWIYGGNNMNGSAAEPSYDGAALAGKGAVVVTFNYRLNVFGYLAHPELSAESPNGSSGNYGLLDQIAALEWVRRNIAAFGGDPDRVTIFGESAGGTDVAYLMSSPLARGLFHRAIIQSAGYAVAEFRDLAELEKVGEGLASALGVDGSEDVLSAMRAVSADQLLQTSIVAIPIGINVPPIDGWLLPDAPARIFERGDQADVPLIIGINADEWTTLRHYSPDATAEKHRGALGATYGALADRALQLYPASTDAEAAAATDAWQTDTWFTCPSRFIADRMANVSSDAYFYVFSRVLPAPGGEELRAYHGAEIPYVWDTLGFETWVPREPYDQSLADIMSSSWVRFAVTGDPNGGDLPAWPTYDRGSGSFLELGDEIQAGSDYRAEHCALYDEQQTLRMANIDRS